jgi:hypothetical protein
MTTSAGVAATLRSGAVDRVLVALLLVVACALSAAGSGYLVAAGLTPLGPGPTPSAIWGLHLIGLAAAGLALLDRLWAMWAVTVLIALFLVVGIVRFPVTLLPGLPSVIGWFSNDVHIGLLVLAGYLHLRRG